MMATAPNTAGAGALDTPDLKLGALRPGLADPVHDAQRIFRGLLTALAQPGHAVDLADAPEGPRPLDPATTAAALTLLDYDTPLWLDWIADTPPLRGFLKFHCGCPIAETSQAAAFALVSDPENMPRLALFAQGLDLYPDRSATLLVQVPSLTAGAAVTLSGPGIQNEATIAPAGLPEWFWNDWRINAGQYPLGVDVFFTCGSTVIGLPRSVLAED